MIEPLMVWNEYIMCTFLVMCYYFHFLFYSCAMIVIFWPINGLIKSSKNKIKAYLRKKVVFLSNACKGLEDLRLVANQGLSWHVPSTPGRVIMSLRPEWFYTIRQKPQSDMPRIMFQIWPVIFSDFSHQLINTILSWYLLASDRLVVCDHKSLNNLGLANQVIGAKEERKLIYAAHIESQNKHLPTNVTLYVIYTSCIGKPQNSKGIKEINFKY